MNRIAPPWPPLKSHIAGINWPPLLHGLPATLWALLQQLENTQWHAPEQLQAAQQRQLALLIHHAAQHSAHFAQRLHAAALTEADVLQPEGFAALPVLTRAQLQTQASALVCAQLPPAHQPVSAASSSGSTGEPVTVQRSAINHLFWLAFTLREHRWHAREFGGRLAAIRARLAPEQPLQQPDWGMPVNLLFESGPGYALPINCDVREQLQWLRDIGPHYLITYPNNLAALLDEIETRHVHLPSLRQIRSVGETLAPPLRERTRRLLNIDIADVYSSQELGTMALQCPASGLYHLMAEGYVIEILDAAGQPCKPGEIGRVVVTDLHNFAMPLLRYDTTDFAEAAAPCPCGRGLPTVRRFVGRERNMVWVNGSRRWPLYGFDHFLDIVPALRQYQLVQHSAERIEVKLFCTAPPGPAQLQRLEQLICEMLGQRFTVQFTLLRERIPAGPGGKFEEFVCRL